MRPKLFGIIFCCILGLLYSACDTLFEEPIYPTACFDLSYEGEQIWESYVAFTNCSEHAASYLWDFGDDSVSHEENPSHYYLADGMYIVRLTASNDAGEDIASDTVLVGWTQVDKPNIYLYPGADIELCIDLEFPQGGEVVKSIPNYAGEWCVSVDSSGKIDQTYDYLFYESIQPDRWQYEEGWCVKKEELREFFQTNMKSHGFIENELNDFTDHWIPLLQEHAYYLIYPQYSSRIDQLIKINFSVQPDHQFRLFYGIKGVSEYSALPKPHIEQINRDGFEVVEWGVFRK